MMRKKKKQNTAQLHVVFSESWRKQGKGHVDFKAPRLRSLRNHRLRPPYFSCCLGGPPEKFGNWCFWGCLFSAAFWRYWLFFAERRLLSTLNFLLCFSTNLNVLLAICMLFCFLEGLWDDLKLERLSIKTNDLVQRKDMIFLPSPRVSKLQIYFPKNLPQTAAPSFASNFRE